MSVVPPTPQAPKPPVRRSKTIASIWPERCTGCEACIAVAPHPDCIFKVEADSTVPNGMIVCDVIPNPPQTPFLKEATARGAQTLDGLGMLVYQGAIGFKMWTGHDAPVAVMRQALAEAFDLA